MTPIESLPSIPGNGPAVMTGVSCADPSLCVAVDQSGNVSTSTNPGGRVAAWIVSGIDGQAALSGISCPGEGLCVAVGGLEPNHSGVVVTSKDPRDGPRTWTVTALDNASALTAVSTARPCSTASRACVHSSASSADSRTTST
ncbi:MAG: hypothetical protein WB808_12890 [Candidatus Dormiibacterota bacterium]